MKWPVSMDMKFDNRHVVTVLDIGFRDEVEEKLTGEYLRIINDEKLISLVKELESLKIQEQKAREEEKNILADALEKAIEYLDAEIRQN